MAPQNFFLIGCMTAVEHYIFHCKSERCHFIPKSSNESQEIVYWDNVLRSNSGRLLVRKNGRLRYTARCNVGNRIMVFSTALWQKCWIP
ncbi:hypothetical protein EMCRGX_G010468 [Ephydatia muelleri]